jgi:hypothetical protein
LLIIPNNGLAWFSFIFKTYNQLPKPVISFFLSQAVVTERATFAGKSDD